MGLYTGMKINYKEIFDKKRKIIYDTVYASSALLSQKAVLGTIEKDASAHFGLHIKEKFKGEKIFKILKNKNFETVLDIGAGDLEATKEFISIEKIVDICDFSDSYYLQNSSFDKSKINDIYIGDINTLNISKTYDAVWCSHVLEHQLNPNFFLKKVNSLIKEDGFLAIIVPPRKPFIVGGHVNMYNAGMLLYHLILAGFDCSDAQVLQYDYNIGIVVQKKTINSFPKIHYDIGDIDVLKRYFPIDVCEGFNGDIMEINVKDEKK